MSYDVLYVGTTAGGSEAFCKYREGYKDQGSLFTSLRADRAYEQWVLSPRSYLVEINGEAPINDMERTHVEMELSVTARQSILLSTINTISSKFSGLNA